MQYDTTMIQAYLQDTALQDISDQYPMLCKFHKPDAKRKDVVEELAKRLQQLVESFPVFNEALWPMLFPDCSDFLDSVKVIPVVGTDDLYAMHSKELALYIDLIQVANVSPIVSQMEYVMQNILHMELAQLCIREQYPLPEHQYRNLLDYFTFANGLAHFIAWNTHAKHYKFYTPKYETHKERVFSLLYSSLKVENKAMQHKVLQHATTGDLWDQFPSAAGLFYYDDMFQEYGYLGIQDLYQQGWKGFVSHIFESE